jgi:hypothetical protein
MATKIRVQGSSRMEIEVTDWRFLVREVRKIDPRLTAKFKANAKEIGKDVENEIKRAIPSKIDIKGMQPKVIPGRMSWGGKVSAQKTSLKIDTRIKKRGKSIVSVWVWSPAVAMLDMAKNAGRGDGGDTREYPYSRSKTGTRTHRVNGQGRGLLQAAGKSKKLIRAERASRVVWPAAWKALPEVNARMNKLIESEARRINAEMRRKQ